MKAKIRKRTFYFSTVPGEKRTAEAENLEALIGAIFPDRDACGKSAASVQRKEKPVLCTYGLLTRKTERHVADADVKPFNWRQKHR